MDHFNEESLYKYFEKTIKSESVEIIQEIEKELVVMREKALKNVSDELEKSKEINLEAKKKLLYQKHQKNLSDLKHKYDLELMRIRNGLVNELINELKKKLIEYTKTDEYVSKMSDIIEKYRSDIDYIEISKTDSLNKKIKDIKIQTNDEIIGGVNIVLKKSSFQIDTTFNSKIEDAKKWFHQNSKLFVVEK
ncbi:V-type ATP synthase subunit E family protein [Haploplasma axanthum]|nr:hypothetical protein [Haploplasma axanthum]